MQSLFDFIIKPKNERYDNKKYIDGQELLVNTEISDHRYVSRTGVVLGIPKSEKTEIKVGDEVKFAAFAGKDVKVEGKEYFLMPETDIQGIIEK